MKPDKMDEKLKRLAESMKDFPIEGTTKIDPNCLTERERKLVRKVDEIQEKYAPNLPPLDVLHENRELFIKASEIVVRRVLDLFVTVMPKAFLGDEIEEWYFKLHFYNFMKDWIDCINNVQKWTEEDREEWKKDMKESGMINMIPRLPHGWSEEDKQESVDTLLYS